MKRGLDIKIQVQDLEIIHHNKPGLEIPKHSHLEHHLIVPVRGPLNVEIGDTSLSCVPGRMVYIPSDCVHRFVSSDTASGERLICLIGNSTWKRHVSGKYEACVLPAHQLCKEILFYLLLKPGSKSASHLIATFLSTLEETLEGNSQLYSVPNDLRVIQAVDYIRENFQNKITMSQVARHSGLSERNLARLFVEETGLAPKSFLIQTRIDEAKRLLAAEGRSVTEAAFEVGFGSLSVFIEAFRARTGQLPSEYRG